MNGYLNSINQNSNGFIPYWDQLYTIAGAIVILLVGWLIALLISGAVNKFLNTCGINEKLSHVTGHFLNIEKIIVKVIFWIILIIAVIGALNILNLTSISGPFSNMIQQFLLFIPKLIAAIAIGGIGWILAKLIKVSVQKLLDRTALEEKLNTEVGVAPISSRLSEIAYWLILLLFIPIVLSILGLNGLLFPIQNMINQAISYLPNLFIAGVILFVGHILAKIMRGIVEGVLSGLSLQQHAEKLGLFKNTNLSKFTGSFVFAVIILTSFIIAFEALGVEAISQPATAMLYEIMYAIPHIIAAILILAIAYILAKFVSKIIVDIVAGMGVDTVAEKLGMQQGLGQCKASTILGRLIIFFTMLFAVSEAAHRLGLSHVSDLIAIFIKFGANILLGIVILLIGFWFANIVVNIIQRTETTYSRWLSHIVRVLIVGLVIAMGLKAMGIADSIVNLAFGLTLGSVAVAFALAFGLGGRKPAEQLLTNLMDKSKQEMEKPVASMQQKNLKDYDKGENEADHLKDDS